MINTVEAVLQRNQTEHLADARVCPDILFADRQILAAEIERLQAIVDFDKQRRQRQVEVSEYRKAPSGEGEYAMEWKDKPHRLFWEVCDEVERLRETLKSVQWRTISGSSGQSAYPTCIGCGIVSHGSLSTPPHNDDCVIEQALRIDKAAEQAEKGGG